MESEYFKSAELRRRRCGREGVQSELLDVIESLRARAPSQCAFDSGPSDLRVCQGCHWLSSRWLSIVCVKEPCGKPACQMPSAPAAMWMARVLSLWTQTPWHCKPNLHRVRP